jgi:PAS domain S-box-containing protein
LASIRALLDAWRAAERHWELPGSADQVRAAALQVVHAWAAYQDAALAADTTEFMLVADDMGTYFAATQGVTRVLGFRPEDLLGRGIDEFTAPELRAQTPEQWSRFLVDGRQEGSYRLKARDGTLVSVRYQARAHHPVPGFHMSRLWPAHDRIPFPVLEEGE